MEKEGKNHKHYKQRLDRQQEEASAQTIFKQTCTYKVGRSA